MVWADERDGVSGGEFRGEESTGGASGWESTRAERYNGVNGWMGG